MAFSDFSVFAGSRTGIRPLGHLGHHYDPNQPRVPAGHPDGGEWTREWHGVEEGQARALDRLDARSAGKARVVSDELTEWKLGAQYAANDDTADPSHSGLSPNERHRQGVQAAIKDYLQRGYAIVRDGPVAVAGCEDMPDLRKIALRDALKRANIPFRHGGRPGEFLP